MVERARSLLRVVLLPDSDWPWGEMNAGGVRGKDKLTEEKNLCRLLALLNLSLGFL